LRIRRKIVTDQLRSYPAAKAEIPSLAEVKHVCVLSSFGLIRQHLLKRHLLRASLYRKQLGERFAACPSRPSLPAGIGDVSRPCIGRRCQCCPAELLRKSQLGVKFGIPEQRGR
jgi:hypothetical protein